jgi:O-antigen/teichoic acid export membrane protein
MAQTAIRTSRLAGFVQRATSDSLVRNSLYLMASTVTTAGLGYIYWIVCAHVFTKQEVGVSSAVVSMCTTVSLLTYLGPSAMLVEQLPRSEHSPEWTATLYRVCSATTLVTGVATALVVPPILLSHNYQLFYVGPFAVLIAVLGAAAVTLLNLLCAAFIAARRGLGVLIIQTLVSVAKLLLLFPLARDGAIGLVDTWLISAVLGVIVGIVWMIPQIGLGRKSNYKSHRSAGAVRSARRTRRRPARHRRGRSLPDRVYIRRLVGQHLTSVGGMVTPLLLPVVVVMRLGDASNADFYITWMMGSVFFMVSPSVATAVFAEGVRSGADLRSEVNKALRMIALLLMPTMMMMMIAGRPILMVFGASYAKADYVLLIVFAVSAIPDAVTNVAVSICRVNRRLGYSAGLNLGILVVTLVGGWVLMPRLGVIGAGVAWGGAQTLGAIASLPAYVRMRRPALSWTMARRLVDR